MELLDVVEGGVQRQHFDLGEDECVRIDRWVIGDSQFGAMLVHGIRVEGEVREALRGRIPRLLRLEMGNGEQPNACVRDSGEISNELCSSCVRPEGVVERQKNVVSPQRILFRTDVQLDASQSAKITLDQALPFVSVEQSGIAGRFDD